MCSVQALREFINGRLTAAAGEIFTVFEQTIVQYEEEIDRQRRLLDISWKPQIKFHRTGSPQQDVWQGEQLCNQQTNISLDQQEPKSPQIKEEPGDPEPLHIKEEEEDTEPPQFKEEQEQTESPQFKEEQEERYILQEEEQLVLKQETGNFVEIPIGEESYHSETDPDSEELLSHSFTVADPQVQEKDKHVDSRSTQKAKLKPNKKSHSDNSDGSPVSENQSEADADKKCLKCEICGKTFKFVSQIQLHHRIHTGEKPHSCHICGKRFIQKQHLKNHIKIHTGEKPYACETCGKSFSDQGNFMVHVRTHTGEKPYPCTICEKRFTNSSALKSHTIIHTGEKPFSCQICGRRFIQKQHLKKHTIIHTGVKPHSCVICGKSFTQQSTMVRHMRTHRGEKLPS